MVIHKKVKLIGKILFYTVFVAVFLLVIGMIISKMNNRVFFVANRSTIWVMTDSMEDQIPERSYIQIRKITPSEIQVGDIITFYSDDPMLKGQLNTHRVVEIAEDGKSYVTRGDNNIGDDKYPARADAVVGVYEKNLPLVSVVGRAVQSRTGLICIFVLMIVLITVSFAGDSFKKLFKATGEASSSDDKN